MRLWWEVARRGFRRYATYRWATFAGVFTNTVFGFMRAYVMLTLFELTSRVSGYTATDALTYSFVSQALIMPLYLWAWLEIADTVYSGQIATDLYRPFDYQFYWLSQDLGRALYHTVLRGIPPFVVGALVFHLRLPTHPETWLVLAVSLSLAVTVSFALRFMVNLTAFWLVDVRGVSIVASALWTMLSGFVIPLAFFPDTARTVLRALPFAAMVEFPMDVFLERARGVELLNTLVLQAAWAVVLLLAGRLVLAAATRKLVVQGG
jgi:viologen exporter family transport system permease protein